MQTVYKLHLPKNDFDGGGCSAAGVVTVPIFDCEKCGVDTDSFFWCASLNLKPGANRKDLESVPKKAESRTSYFTILEKLKSLFGATNRSIAPGSILGRMPIEVRSKSTIGGLNTKHLKRGIDVIHTNENWVFSKRVKEALERSGCVLPPTQIEFNTGDSTFKDYWVEELPPRNVLTAQEREKYQVSICEICGSCLRGVRRGTFAPKEFDREVFQNGTVIVRGDEFAGIYMNEAAYQLLTSLELQGCQIKPAGEWR